MSRNFVAASSQNLHSSTVPVTAPPFTLACWVKPSSLGVRRTLMAMKNTGAGASQFNLRMTAANVLEAQSFDGSTNATADGTTALTNGVWIHACMVSSSSSSRSVFTNGTDKHTNTSTATPSGLNEFDVGALNDGGFGDFWDGDIGYMAVWSSALADSDVASLAAGALPSSIQNGTLVGFWLNPGGTTSPEPDAKGTNSLTVVGATQGTTDPPIVLGSNMFVVM